MKSKLKSGLAALLAVVMVAGYVTPALAAVEDSADNTPAKAEVVYGILDHDGTVAEVYVVNSYKIKEPITFTDYGSYTEVRNMNTQAQLLMENGAVTITAGPGELYYQGTVAEAQLPWSIKVTYKLDGRTVTGEQLAGGSGALEIAVDITRNSRADSSFFDSYALQTTVTLDTMACSNIVARGATSAFVGSDQQLTYTILPGNEKSITITADVEDFEMAAMTFNGVNLNLDIEVDDQELLDQVKELTDAIVELDDGAGELLDGAYELQDGAGDLRKGAKDMRDGIAEIQGGIDILTAKSAELKTGSATMLAALRQMQAELDAMTVTAADISALVGASAAIQNGIDDAAAGAAVLQSGLDYNSYLAVMAANGADISDIQAGNATAAAMLRATISDLEAADPADPNIPALQTAAAMLEANNDVINGTAAYFGGISGGADTLVYGLDTLSSNYGTFHTNIEGLATTLSTLPAQMEALKTAITALATEYAKMDSGIGEYTAGVSALTSGFKELKKGANELVDGTKELVEGVDELVDGCVELTDGTAEMREETSGLEGDITQQVDEMIESVTGSEDAEVISFMSPDNASIKSVQFALRTAAIEKAEAAEVVETAELPPTLWDKIRGLLGKT